MSFQRHEAVIHTLVLFGMFPKKDQKMSRKHCFYWNPKVWDTEDDKNSQNKAHMEGQEKKVEFFPAILL